jgi:hypothetical protein
MSVLTRHRTTTLLYGSLNYTGTIWKSGKLGK